MTYLERYFFKPSFLQKILSYLLLPLSFVYFFLAYLNRFFTKKYFFEAKIISIGNITAGGSGKTPFLIEIAKRYKNIAVVTRGYGRHSKGILSISKNGAIKQNVFIAGDEAFLIAKSLKNASVIVCENRKKGIEKAINEGKKIIFLDDAFRYNFSKFDIVLLSKNKPYFNFMLPSGYYKEPKSFLKYADIVLQEGIDYKREVDIINKKNKMILVTAIANPSRLDEFLPKEVCTKIYYKDHSYFKEENIKNILKDYNADSILVTFKDYVKLSDFFIPISIMHLKLSIDNKAKETVDNYIKNGIK